MHSNNRFNIECISCLILDSNATTKPVNAVAITSNNLQQVYGIPVVPIIASATLSCVPPPPTPRNFRIPSNASIQPESLPNSTNEHASDDGNLNPDVPEFVPDFLGKRIHSMNLFKKHLALA